MRIEPYQGGYRMIPTTSATSAVRAAQDKSVRDAAQCGSCPEPVKVRDIDRVELTSLSFKAAKEATKPLSDSQQRIRENLVAGMVNQHPDFGGPGGNQVLNRAYFLSDQSVAQFNAAAVGRAIDVQA